MSKVLNDITADLRNMEHAKSCSQTSVPHANSEAVSKLDLQRVSSSVSSILQQRAEERARMRDLSFGEY